MQQQGYPKVKNFLNDYALLMPPLAKGEYSEVREGIHKLTGAKRAVKIIFKRELTNAMQEGIQVQAKNLEKLDHPNIIKIFDFYQDEKFYYIVTELCNGQPMFDWIRSRDNIPENEAAKIIKQVLTAVNYCHQQKIVHRDINIENLIFETENDNSLLKIIGFDNSKEFKVNQKLDEKIGTPFYIAPEVLNKKYDEKCDIWSCGVILYMLLCGSPPFNGDTTSDVLKKVKNGAFAFDSTDWDKISLEAKQFIRKLLEYDSSKRYSATQALQDPWIQKLANIAEVEQSIIKRVLENLGQSKQHNEFQEACFKYIVNHTVTNEEKQELQKIFQFLDKNNDGRLDKQELLIGYQQIMDSQEAQVEVEKIFSYLDKDVTGTLTYTQFIIASIDRKQLLSQERLQLIYNMFNKNKNEILNLERLMQICEIPENLKKQMKNIGNTSKDGEISLDEFCFMMKS